jgi:phenylalanyl-tRNA synthetase beta chain
MHVIGSRVRSALVASGMSEVRPLPYVGADPLARSGMPLVRVRNPLADDEPFLRESVLTTLARRAEHNLSRMQGDVRIFEIGTSFIATPGGLREEVRVGALVMGARRPRHFTEPSPPPFDAWDAKALAETIARAAWPGTGIELVPGIDGELWRVQAAGRDVGAVLGVALDAPVWAAPAYGVEITLGDMPAAPVAPRGAHDYSQGGQPTAGERGPVRYVPLPVTPAAEFDLALIVPDAMSSADVERTIRAASGEMLEAVVLFDEYRGEGVPAFTRSLAWRLTFRHPERTLRDKEIEGRRSQLLKALEKEIGVVARAN